MLRYLLAACLATFLPVATLAQGGLESLDRLDQVRDWRAVGLLQIGSRGTCTGTLIEADLVLTAAHCLVDDTGTPYRPEQLLFRAGFQHGQQAARVPGVAIAVPEGYHPEGRAFENGFVMDVGLLRLSYPVLSTRVSPFRVVPLLSRDERLAVVSYGQGRNDAPSLQRVCNLEGEQGGIIAMDCLATHGSSGAPIFVMRDGGPRVAGVLTGVAVSAGQHRSIGVPADNWLPVLRRQINGLNGQVGAPSGGSVTILRPGDRSDTGARFVRVGE